MAVVDNINVWTSPTDGFIQVTSKYGEAITWMSSKSTLREVLLSIPSRLDKDQLGLT